ncbi:MAG: sulfurtransferase TusA family protein [Rhodospirillales bacterium]|nr:sulfurtransferase TusA family protein [Rhodospirillales bacterium]
MREQFDFFLDITEDVCPLTFVRTKLLLERMPAGSIAMVRLQGAEPLANVPRALALAGHEILTSEAEDPEGADPFRPHRLRVRKVARQP